MEKNRRRSQRKREDKKNVGESIGKK